MKPVIVGTMTYMPEDSEDGPIMYELIATRSIARRESAAPSIEEIYIYTANDPTLSPLLAGFVLIMLLPVLLVIFLAYLIPPIYAQTKAALGAHAALSKQVL